MQEQDDIQAVDGQIIFSPSRNPYEELPGFIRGWAITDLVFAGIWCLGALLLASGEIFWAFENACCWRTDLLVGLIPAAVAGSLGLYANIQLLSRKPAAMPAARLLIAFTLLHILWIALIGGMATVSAEETWLKATFGSVTAALLAARITLVVFYWVAVGRAGRYFAGRKRMLGF